MGETKLTEREVEKRIERGHPASTIARLFAASVSKRLRYDARRGQWMQFNAISMKFSPAPEFVVGAQIGGFVIGTARTLLAGGDERMDAALREPDWASIELAARVLLDPQSRFLTAPIEAPQAAPAPQAERRGLQHVPSAPLGARRGTSSVAVR